MQKNPAQSPDYPEGLVSRDRDVMQEIKQVSFRVDEYYKGEGPESISIMMDAALTDPAVRAISLQEGVSYVLFLFQPDSAEGKAYWNQGYLIQGIQQGVWEVNGDVAVRAVGSERSLELNQFEDLPLTNSNPERVRARLLAICRGSDTCHSAPGRGRVVCQEESRWYGTSPRYSIHRVGVGSRYCGSGAFDFHNHARNRSDRHALAHSVDS